MSNVGHRRILGVNCFPWGAGENHRRPWTAYDNQNQEHSVGCVPSLVEQPLSRVKRLPTALVINHRIAWRHDLPSARHPAVDPICLSHQLLSSRLGKRTLPQTPQQHGGGLGQPGKRLGFEKCVWVVFESYAVQNRLPSLDTRLRLSTVDAPKRTSTMSIGFISRAFGPNSRWSGSPRCS